MEKIKIAVVDDHTLFREGLVNLLLKADSRFDIIWEACNGEEFLEKCKTNLPDIVLMDISMPGMDGIEAASAAVSAYPGIRIIALSMFGEQEYYLKMIQAGTKGFLRKDSDIDEVVRAVIRVHNGENYFSENMLYSLVVHKQAPRDEVLSERELQILELICHGFSAVEIADKLFLSKRTVEKHRSNILEKTGCRNTARLVAWALKNNFVK